MKKTPPPQPAPAPLDRTPEALRPLLGQIVVVDTDSAFVYLGCLECADPRFLCLSSVDACELSQANLSKERYVHEAKKIGVRPNRKQTWVSMARVVSISRLEDIVAF